MSPPSVICKVCSAPLGEIAIKNADPYCSTGCAREDHGNPLPNVSIWARDQKVFRKEKAAGA